MDAGGDQLLAAPRAASVSAPARALRDLPSFRAALRDGTVGVDQVNEVARLHANPRCGSQVAGSEAILLQAARQLEYADLCVVSGSVG